MCEQIYIITYSSAHYAGATSCCLVKASNTDEAVIKADEWMWECEWEQNSEQILEDGIDEDECPYSVDRVELLEDSEHKEFEKDEGQRVYYPKLNF